MLNIVTRAKTSNLKENYKTLEVVECEDCKMSLRFLGRDELIYEHCQEIEVMTEAVDFQCHFIGNESLKILVDKHNGGKFKKGDIFSACCFLKSSV